MRPKESMEKLVLFGGGKIGKRVFQRLGSDRVEAVIDSVRGGVFADGVPFISMDDYIRDYAGRKILLCSIYGNEMAEILKQKGIYQYEIPVEVWKREDVLSDDEIAHEKWPLYLQRLCDKPGMDVLELGSRVVTGANFCSLFSKARYVGFDYYEGENVDIVGDIHRVSQYFDHQFDLIFSSAVFEHLAMPWQAALEIIKLLKPGGYVFIETHYAFGSHDRPWHFFQYSENALHVLFPEKFGMRCLKKGCSNLLSGAEFSEEACGYLQGQCVGGLYCHSEFLGQKTMQIKEEYLDWKNICLEDVTGATKYPRKE